MNTLEVQSEVGSRDEEMTATVSTAESSPPTREVLDNFLVRADSPLFIWVFR